MSSSSENTSSNVLGCLPFNILFTIWAFVLDDPQTDATQESEYATNDGRQNLSGPHLVAQPCCKHTENSGADDGRQHLWAYLSHHGYLRRLGFMAFFAAAAAFLPFLVYG